MESPQSPCRLYVESMWTPWKHVGECKVLEKWEVAVEVGGQFTVEVVMADCSGYNIHIYVLAIHHIFKIFK
jgi:hypothetical protein